MGRGNKKNKKYERGTTDYLKQPEIYKRETTDVVVRFIERSHILHRLKKPEYCNTLVFNGNLTLRKDVFHQRAPFVIGNPFPGNKFPYLMGVFNAFQRIRKGICKNFESANPEAFLNSALVYEYFVNVVIVYFFKTD